MTGEIASVLMFAVVCGVLLLGYPVAFSLGGTALIFAVLETSIAITTLTTMISLSS